MRAKLAALALCCTGLAFTAACGDDDNGPTPGEQQAAACAETIAAREASVGASAIAAASSRDAVQMAPLADANSSASAGHYRDNLAQHPGCRPRESYTANTSEPLVVDNATAGTPGSPLVLPGFTCAAKDYTQPNEDTTKPIVVLVHGNSSGVTSFEEYLNASSQTSGNTLPTDSAGDSISVTFETTARAQLATRLIEQGYRVIGFDARTDLIAGQNNGTYDRATLNPFFNRDHAWDVPLFQALVKSLITNYPNRKLSFVTHSLGTTTTRDGLRRMYNEFKAGVAGSVNPYEHVQDLVYASGANHGVGSGTALCQLLDPANPNTRYTVACELADRIAYQPSYFLAPNNGPNDLWAAPCADGSYAFGDRDACGGNIIQYTTLTMVDIAAGALQDEFVSEASARLDLDGCVDNHLTTLADIDRSGFFFTGGWGAFAAHFGVVRADVGLDYIVSKLGD